jgi:hypothetical protein
VDSDQWRELVKYWKSKEGRVNFMSFLIGMSMLILSSELT